jgi:parvulin-like peptidyl-prolyl cis-trans isomerase-like protein
MRYFVPVCVLVGAIVWGQTQPASPVAGGQDRGERKPTSASNIAPETPVLTIKGLCPQRTSISKSSAECQTVITRAQFEKLANALQPEMDAQTKRQLAHSYPQLLEMAHEAEQRGLDKRPRFDERLAFTRLQILSQELIREIQDEAARVPEKDIDDYYQMHSAEFEQVSLERIVVPLRKQQSAQPGAESADLGTQVENDMGKEAEALRARAAAGEDFAKLQKEAYGVAGMSDNSEPDPSIGKTRRRGLPPAHSSVFDLKVGQVSLVITDATGHYIYKMDAREVEPLDSAKPEISNMLRRQRAQQMMKSVEQPFTTDANSTYFGAGGKEDHD